MKEHEAAKAITDRPKILTREDLYRLQREYQVAAAPYLSLLCDIENVTCHKTLINSAGEFKTIQNYSEENLKMREKCLLMLQELRAQIVGPINDSELKQGEPK